MLKLGLNDMPTTPTGWKPWQVIIGYLRQLLNLGNTLGFWPSRKPGILPPRDGK